MNRNQIKLCITPEPEVSVSAPTSTIFQVVFRDATKMRRAIRDAENFVDLKSAVILFIAAMNNAEVFTCEDFLDLAAEAVLSRRLSAKDGLRRFNVALKHAQREAEFWGEAVRK
ncbi:MAG: hypothetical protein LAO08_00295 [Acidobacteriia bacterium]|nr:hypothetical protein [Terriglobia bacterium]